MFSKNAKNKGNRKYKLSSHLTSTLKTKKPYGQSSIKAFLNKSLPENKGKLNMSTSESCAVVRSFSSSSVLRNVKKSLLNLNLDVPISCSEKSEKIFSSLQIPNQCISKDTSVNNLDEPSI